MLEEGGGGNQKGVGGKQKGGGGWAGGEQKGGGGLQCVCICMSLVSCGVGQLC